MDEQNTTPQAQQQPEAELSEILQIRREKLAALQQAGRNPFEETTYEVDAYAKDINENSTNMRENRYPLQVGSSPNAVWEKPVLLIFRIKAGVSSPM